MDQGGELYKNQKGCKIFEKRGFAVYPTGPDASHQKDPVERAHCTVAKGMRSFLLGSSVPIKCWPYAYKHYLQMTNDMPSCGKSESPVSIVTGQRENFTRLATFGCRIWVRPTRPHGHQKRGTLHTDSCRGIFLGFRPNITRNIEHYDQETHQVKIASNFRFDEGFNDLPVN